MDQSITKRARRNYTTILQALAKTSQVRVAELIGIVPSTLSAFKDDHLERLSAVLAACGLKAVPDTEESINAAEVRALRTLVATHLQSQLDTPPESGFGNL